MREGGLRNVPVVLRPGPGMGWGQESFLPRGQTALPWHTHARGHTCTHALPMPGHFQDKEKSLSDQRRYSLIDPSSAPELLRLQHQLMSTEDALRDALDQAQQVEKLMEAMRSSPDKSLVSRGPGLGLPGKPAAVSSWSMALGALVHGEAGRGSLVYPGNPL